VDGGDLAGGRLGQVEDLGDLVRLVARTRTSPVTCPECGEPAARVHDRYWRRLQDLACCGRPVQVVLQVRRFICDSAACIAATFAEQVDGLTAKHQRRTIGLRSLLERVALALAGRAGSRLARVLGAIVSRSTLIRLIRALPDPEIGKVAVLGVDDRAEGMRIAAIQRELRLAPGTARRYFHATTVDELVAGTLAGWPSRLDDYKPHLHQRWNEGCTNIQQLHNEVKALGFRSSYGTVYAYLRPFKGKPAPPAVPAPPKVRHITSWIRRRPGNLDAGEQLKLNEIRAACPHLNALRGHVEEFAKMITGLRGDRLDAWIAAVRTDDLPHLHAFANGLERDHAAVLNGLTLPYSSGAVEGKVGKIKFWKRLMFLTCVVVHLYFSPACRKTHSARL
jgi:transposase